MAYVYPACAVHVTIFSTGLQPNRAYTVFHETPYQTLVQMNRDSTCWRTLCSYEVLATQQLWTVAHKQDWEEVTENIGRTQSRSNKENYTEWDCSGPWSGLEVLKNHEPESHCKKMEDIRGHTHRWVNKPPTGCGLCLSCVTSVI